MATSIANLAVILSASSAQLGQDLARARGMVGQFGGAVNKEFDKIGDEIAKTWRKLDPTEVKRAAGLGLLKEELHRRLEKETEAQREKMVPTVIQTPQMKATETVKKQAESRHQANLDLREQLKPENIKQSAASEAVEGKHKSELANLLMEERLKNIRNIADQEMRTARLQKEYNERLEKAKDILNPNRRLEEATESIKQRRAAVQQSHLEKLTEVRQNAKLPFGQAKGEALGQKFQLGGMKLAQAFGVGEKGMEAMGAMGMEVGAALGPLAAAAGPIGIVVGALVAVGAAAVMVHKAFVSFASFANPASAERYTRAWDDLTAVIGSRLVPYLQFATKVVRLFGDFLQTALPSSDKFQAAFSNLAPLLNSMRKLYAQVAPILRKFFEYLLRVQAAFVKIYASVTRVFVAFDRVAVALMGKNFDWIDIAVSALEIFATAVEYVATAVEAIANTIIAASDWLKASMRKMAEQIPGGKWLFDKMFGKDFGKEKTPEELKSSVGMAPRKASFVGIEELSKQNIAMGFSAGKNDPATNTAANTKKAAESAAETAKQTAGIFEFLVASGNPLLAALYGRLTPTPTR